MKLEVVTPRETLVAAEVDEVTAPGALGEFGVLPGHVPLLTGIRPGVLSWKTGTGGGVIAVGQGFAEVAHERIVVLAEAGELAAKIDADKARRELDEAQKKIDAHADDAGVRAEHEAQRQWAQARLDAATAGGSVTKH